MALYSNTYKFVILVNDFRFCLFFFLKTIFLFCLSYPWKFQTGFFNMHHLTLRCAALQLSKTNS